MSWRQGGSVGGGRAVTRPPGSESRDRGINAEIDAAGITVSVGASVTISHQPEGVGGGQMVGARSHGYLGAVIAAPRDGGVPSRSDCGTIQGDRSWV